MSDGIFSGLRVIDCASWIAGPAAATILSDFGAEVIKIEPPGAGDPWRASSPVPGKTVDYWWQLTSRNKRSLAIDLKAPEGLAVLYRLLATTDVFVTNFPLPVRERLKIAAAEDRKSTRLNSSHGYISYAVFCLKKKKQKETINHLPPNSTTAIRQAHQSHRSPPAPSSHQPHTANTNTIPANCLQQTTRKLADKR